MAEEIKWGRLTLEETETLTALVNSGKEVFAAPIEIEFKEQLKSLGITYDDCKTWRIGIDKVIVHLTPADEATYKMLLGDLREKYNGERRSKRCRIPGKLKPTIVCPECNRCSECPYPEYRDQNKANSLSWEMMTEGAYETDEQDLDAYEDPSFHQIEVKMELDAVCRIIKAANPKFLAAIVLKEYHNLSVKKIAKHMNDTERNVYYYLGEAKRIGKQYKEDNLK